MKSRGPSSFFALGAAALLVFAVVWSVLRHERPQPEQLQAPQPSTANFDLAPTNGPPTNSKTVGDQLLKLRRRTADFSDAQKAAFGANFREKYKPAIERWCQAFSGHVPFSPSDITTDNFVECFGKDASYTEYIFMVNGITFGVRDVNGVAQVDYLNDPEQTRKLATIPKAAEPPISKPPVTREEILQILQADGSVSFAPHEVRIKPTGFSGALNGGAYVQVGGDPENGASWKYDMVFGADGYLAYYLRGH